MAIKPNTQKALDHWLVPTWDTGHPRDERRFYEFLSQYQQDHGFSINESELRKEIERTVKAKQLPFGKRQEKIVHDQDAAVLPVGYTNVAGQIADRRLILAGYRLVKLLMRTVGGY